MSMSKKKLQTFNGEIDIDRIIRVLETERECVSRDCDRDCGKCDLAQDRDWLLSVYDEAIELLKEQPELVRCADCKHIERINGINGCGYRCELWEYSSVLKDGFCNYGERKDE